MKTEQIRLIQDTYTVPAEVGGYLVTCPGCGARINLYDMYHGFCPWCESSMKKHRDRMIRILRTLDYRIDQSESKNVIVPAGYLPVPQLQHWLEHSGEISGGRDARKIVEIKELHEGDKHLRALCAVCLGGAYERALQDRDPEKAKSILHSFRVLLRLLLSNSCPITMRCREKRLQLFTSFRTDHFCFISRKT